MTMREEVPALQLDAKPIRGLLKVELFDAKTKELIQKVEKENLVTKAIKTMLQAYAATDQMGAIMPLASVGLGGIMLFDAPLPVDEDRYLFPADAHLVGYGLQDVDTANTMRGSKNVSESSVILGDSGQSRTVWDFGTSQANGTIKAVALTKNANPFRPLSAAVVAQGCYYSGSNRYTYGSNAVLAYEDGYLYIVHGISSSSVRTGTSGNYTYTRTYTMTITRTYAPMKNYKVGDSPTNSLATPNEVHQTVTWTQVTHNTDPAFNDAAAPCIDFDNDGTAYIVWSPGNASGNGSLYVTRITRNGLSWSASNMEIIDITGAQFLHDYHKVVDGYFYVVSYDRHSIYKIDIANPQDVRQISLPDDWYVHGSYFWRTPLRAGVLFFVAYTDRIVGTQTVRKYLNAIMYPDATVILDGAEITSGDIMVSMRYPLADGYGWGGQIGERSTQYMYGRFFSNYLGTIANLPSPIVKNASQTLKITYSLIDA